MYQASLYAFVLNIHFIALLNRFNAFLTISLTCVHKVIFHMQLDRYMVGNIVVKFLFHSAIGLTILHQDELLFIITCIHYRFSFSLQLQTANSNGIFST